MSDPTESFRRAEVARINADPGSREALEATHGQVWDTTETCQDFDAVGFGAPYVVVVRKADQVKGTLTFQHDPRFYYNFTPA